MRILIVDDKHLEELETVISGLSELNHHVETKSDGVETLNYLKDHHLKVDLILMDELLKPGAIYDSGALLGKEISQKHPLIPLILYTGTQKNEDKMHQVLTDCGFSDIFLKGDFDADIEYHLHKVCALKSVTGKFQAKSEYCDELLYNYFNNILEPERNQLYNALRQKDIDLLERYKIKSGAESWFAVDIMLHPVNVITGHSLEFYFQYYLDQTKKDYKFRGKWNDAAMQRRLAQYWALSRDESRKKKDEIDFKAFEILLNILIIQYLVNEVNGEGIIEFLSVRNKKISATAGVTNKKNGFNNFIDKLICRRAAIGFDEFGLVTQMQEFERKHVAALLRHGSTDPRKDTNSKKEEHLKIPSVYATHLGLFTDQVTECVEKDENKILQEEIEWLEYYGKFSQRMASFLLTFKFPQQKPFDQIKFKPHIGELTDITVFKDYVRELKKKISQDEWRPVLGYIESEVNALPERLTQLVDLKTEYT
ncbi:MAG TPA: response regulator [Mucilaginibacter sp.]|jgi:CheY-like chemotaxis protein